jgi:hypothetical protein
MSLRLTRKDLTILCDNAVAAILIISHIWTPADGLRTRFHIAGYGFTEAEGGNVRGQLWLETHSQWRQLELWDVDESISSRTVLTSSKAL